VTLDGAMDAGRIDHVIRVYRDGLLEDTLPFWLRHGADPGPGSIVRCLDRDGSVLDTDKGAWQQGRFAWMLGRAWHAVEQRPEWLEAAAHTLRFIEAHCIDADGRMFFHVTRDGRLSSPIKGNLYEGCFHLPRQQLVCWQIAEEIRQGRVGGFKAT